MILMMDMLIRGFNAAAFRGGENVSIQMDYALESPDMIPSGACQQYEIDTGDEDNGLPAGRQQGFNGRCGTRTKLLAHSIICKTQCGWQRRRTQS